MDKTLVLKLGNACNLKCKHCHCSTAYYKYNKDVIKYIINNKYEKIIFGGGEPLIYINLIKRIVDNLPSNMKYKMVTNGTMLTYDLAEYFNNHNFKVIISYDGNNNSRDRRFMQCWDEYSKINQKGVSTLFSVENQDVFKFEQQLEMLRNRYMQNAIGASIWFNFPHQTIDNNNNETTLELVKKYCKTMAVIIETDFIKYKQGQRFNLSALGMGFEKWIRKSNARGVKCFNSQKINLTIDGRFLLCPYGEQYVGDIYTGIDWNKVESYIPDKCKSCPQWESCMNNCIANITDNECYISKVMYKHFYKLMNKYNVTYDELANFIGR